MTVTRSQRIAAKAYECVSQVKAAEKDKYHAFAKKLPVLIHTCGLAQAVAFGASKDDCKKNIEDLGIVLGRPQLANESVSAQCMLYIHLTREAMLAAGWLKRYAEALLED